MAQSKFDSVWEGFLELIGDGASFKDACREMGVQEKTVRNWLARGRKEDDGKYAEFATIFDTAKEEVEQQEGPLTREEWEVLTSRAARAGSVQALKLYDEYLRRGGEGEDDEDDFDALDGETEDELEERRRAKAG